MKTSIAAILLSGGTGTRFGSSVPKQYLPLDDMPIALHAFLQLVSHPLIDELIVVCDAFYDSLFSEGNEKQILKPLRFARPGLRRQDSSFNGFQTISADITHILIHDAARPFITEDMISRVILKGISEGAATVAVPVKATIKEADDEQNVIKTPNRSRLFEIQTPQVIRRDLLENGFLHAEKNGLTATDDVYFAEILGHNVKLVQGCYSNIKITTIEDLEHARSLIARKTVQAY